jgi:hypothetical protein
LEQLVNKAVWHVAALLWNHLQGIWPNYAFNSSVKHVFETIGAL